MAVSMSLQSFFEFMLITKAHYEAWLSAWYQKVIADDEQEPQTERQDQQRQYVAQTMPQIPHQVASQQVTPQSGVYRQIQQPAAAYRLQGQAAGY